MSDRPFAAAGRIGRTCGLVLALALAAGRARAQHSEPAPAPMSPFAVALAQKMRSHPYLARHTFDAVETHAPYLFFVQRPAESTAPRAAELASATVALLDPVRERFARDVAAPLSLVQRADVPALAVIVLRSPAAFEECYRATSGAWHFDARATFARDVGAAVLYDDPGGTRDALERARSARHALVHVLQGAHYAPAEPAPVRCWLFEGMADYLARPAPGEGFPAPERLAEFVRDARDPGTRWAHLRTLEEMCAIDEPLHLEEFFRARTPDESLLPGADQDPWTAFYREATLVYAFLASAEDARDRAGFTKWLASAFAGKRKPDALAASFAPRKLPELDGLLLEWVQREHKRAFPGEKVKPEVVLAALARAEPVAPGAEPAGRPAQPEPGRAATPARPATAPAATAAAPATRRTPLVPLTLSDATPEERLALAIQEVGAGRLRSARARLAELAGTADTRLAERAAREDRRAAAWEAARDAFLARLVAEKTVIPLDLGPRVSAKEFGVRAFSEGLVELDDQKGGIRRVPVESLDTLALAREMRTGPPEDDWKRLYLFVLRGNEQWKKLLKPEGDEQKSLLADAREDYPARISLGQAMAKIAVLSDRPLPATPKEAEQRAAVFRSLLGEHSTSSVVERKRAQLRAHLQAVLERQFELVGPAALLAGKLETLGSERVRITYSFDDPRELDDFSAEPYPLIASRGLGTTRARDVPFQVSKGALIALGQATLRTLYDLEAPLTVRYDVAFEAEGESGIPFYLALGVCDDGAEHFVWAVNLNSLQRFEQLDTETSPQKDSTFQLGRPNALELRHDGSEVKLLCDGRPQCSLAAGARQHGAIFLRTSTDLQFSMQKLVIEGRLRPDGFERMKRAWAQRQMTGL